MATMSRDQAIAILQRFMAPQLQPAMELEQDWELWLRTLFGRWVSDKFGNPIPFAEHHHTMWEWCWSIRQGIKSAPLIAILPRGGAKSTTAELMIAALAARRTRTYGLYICATQPQADDHVQNVGALLESPKYTEFYPAAANKRVNKYGYASGWNRQRLRTASGFTLDSIGLDTAARGVKLEEARPDFIVLDDIDKELDTPEATEKKIKLITTAMLPAGSTDAIVLGVQNLVIEDGVFARLANLSTVTKKADFLQNRIMVGPLPAIRDAQVIVPTGDEEEPSGAPEGYMQSRAGKYTIVGGTPIWAGQNLEKAQADIDEWGYTAWLTEAQQDVESPTNGLFGKIDFEKITITDAEFAKIAPNIVRTVVWCDPAVTATDHSDNHGIQVDSLGSDDVLYRRRSWEGVATPGEVLRKAITWAIELKADHVGVETDQGGDLWEIAFNKTWDEMDEDGTLKALGVNKGDRVAFTADKAGSGYGSKAHRGSLMLRDYESSEKPYGVIRHVAGPEGYHLVLKRALLRAFIKKPYDLADAAFWAWNDLKGEVGGGIGASSDEPTTTFGTRRSSALGSSLHAHQPGGPDEAYRAGSDRMRIGRLWAGHVGQRSMWRTSTLPSTDSEDSLSMSINPRGAVQGESSESVNAGANEE